MAILGGVLFNLANILLVAAFDIAGMAVAFPVGIGIALVEGVLINYVRKPKGDPLFLFLGVAGVAIAIIVDAMAYKRLARQGQRTPTKGIVLSIVAGVLMGVFYYLVAASMTSDAYAKANPGQLEPGQLGPVRRRGPVLGGAAALQLRLEHWVMAKPFVGEPVPFADYFSKGQRAAALDRDRRRDDLECRLLVQHGGLGEGGLCDFLRVGAGRDDDRRHLGRVHLAGVQKRTGRNQQAAGPDVRLLRHRLGTDYLRRRRESVLERKRLPQAIPEAHLFGRCTIAWTASIASSSSAVPTPT